MKTKSILLLIVALFLFGGMGCEKKENTTPPTLVGSWKCIGFGDTKTGEVKEIEPKDCDKCYTITFKDDGTLSGQSSTNEISGEYLLIQKSIQILRLGGTKINELFDGNLYIESLQNISKYEIKSGELKLFYTDQNYLLFKKI
ncbi:MAG: META domain-containing protein [Bacteroidia bacterium]|nr:META domain-containing protein [Bacteroidia bacterium]